MDHTLPRSIALLTYARTAQRVAARSSEGWTTQNEGEHTRSAFNVARHLIELERPIGWRT